MKKKFLLSFLLILPLLPFTTAIDVDDYGVIPPEPIAGEESIAYILIGGNNTEKVFLTVCNETLCFFRQEMMGYEGNYSTTFTVPHGEKLLLKFEILDKTNITTWFNASGISIIPMIPVGNTDDNDTPSFTVILAVSATVITALILGKRKNNTLK